MDNTRTQRKKIVLINGRPGVGKDTFMDLCGMVLDIKYKHVKRTKYSVIDPIKRAARDIGWSGNKTPEERNLLSDLKDFADAHLNTTRVMTKHFIDMYVYEAAGDSIMFICIRESEDAKDIYRLYGNDVLGVYVDGHRAEKPAGNHADNSAMTWDRDCFPLKVDNNGSLSDLMESAEKLIDMIFGSYDGFMPFHDGVSETNLYRQGYR